MIWKILFSFVPSNKSQATHFMEINRDGHQGPIQVQVRADNQVTVGQLPGFGHCTRLCEVLPFGNLGKEFKELFLRKFAIFCG